MTLAKALSVVAGHNPDTVSRETGNKELETVDVDSSFKKNDGERRGRISPETTQEDGRLKDSLFQHRCFIVQSRVCEILMI